MKIKIFCEEQLQSVIAKCVAEATEYCRDLDGADTDADFVNQVATMIFKEQYYVADHMRLLFDQDDALIQE